jgi:2-phosphosulfolactate phosphatase
MITVYYTPKDIKPNSLQRSVAVVIDVLRATSVATYAAANGAAAVIPIPNLDEARQRKISFGDEAVLGGERGGLPIEGFDFGNSPQHYTEQRSKGKTLLLSTTNGAVAVQAAKQNGAARVYLASFLNAQAVVETLRGESDIAIICSGTNGKATEEDTLLADYLIARLNNDQGAAGLVENLLEKLRNSTGGRNLTRIGLAEDIFVAAALDKFNVVPTV